MLTLNDGRNELWQWDTGRKLTVDADCSQIHFSNKVFGRSIDVDVVDGVAIIPDVLLQTDKDLNVLAFVGTAENGYTKISKTFKVNRRNKPADYVFTPSEQTTLAEIMERLDGLESIQDPDAIKNAVDDYLANNPIKVDETDPTVPEWAKQATPPDVKIPSKLPNPNALTFTGAVSGTYDGSAPVTLNIPDSGGNVELDTTLTQSGKAADAKAVGDKIAAITGISLVEPADDDIPKVYFTGTLPTSKTEEGERLTMHYISKTADFIYPVTLNVQGASSTSYPKKNFTLKPYKDSTYEKKQKLTFKNWSEMNKFVLKAHWIDHSHVRNVGTAKIWGKIVKSRSDYNSLPEELRNAPNNGATDGFTCKVFCNGVYQGLYEWIVPKDKLFGQDSDIATHSILNSEWNNQSTCAFATTSPTINGNWSEELLDSMTAETKISMENWIKFVAGSTDEEFVANAENYFDVQSVIDADIFDRVFCTVDNLCRNQIVFKYDSKWFMGKWDLDAVLGLPPVPGGSFFAYNTEYQNGYLAYKNYGITNLLYQRVENLFLDRFKARYAELRSGVLSIENILDVYERMTDVITTYDGLLAEDFASTTGDSKFTGIPYTSENNIQQIRAFVSQRIPYMDEVIANMTGESGGGEVDPDKPDVPETIPCTGITLGKTELTFDGKGTKTITATVTPSNTTDTIGWVSSAPAVASVSVEGNVCTVQSVANGDAVITATCGEYSATCSVSVSGIEAENPANLLADAEFEKGYVDYLTGANVAESSSVINANNIATKTFVPVDEGATYIVDCKIDGEAKSPEVGVRYFDGDKVYTKEYFGETHYMCPIIFTVPSGKNIEYLKLQFVLAKAFSDATLPNVHYSLYPYNAEDYMSKTNILDGVDWVHGLFNGNTGVDMDDNSFARTRYFIAPGVTGKRVRVEADCYVRIAWYDSAKAKIGAVYTETETFVEADIPENAVFLRISVAATNANVTVKAYNDSGVAETIGSATVSI